MKKQSRRFEFVIPMTVISGHVGSTKVSSNGDLHISGVGYYKPEEEPEDRYDYDIDQVLFEGKNILPVLKWMEGEAKEIDEIHNAAMSHIENLFSPENTYLHEHL